MSIQSEITLLQGTKKEIRNAIMEKGVTVSPSDLFSSYPTRISQISMTPGDKDTLFRSMIERTETSLVIPTGTEVIRYGGFTHYDTLASITIPDTVTTIEDAVFVASGLTSVTIPKNVTSIGIDAFRGCSSLGSITVNAETPPTLGTRAFDNTNNCPIYVPEDSVEAYKSAWSQYADRIQAIPQDNTLFNSIVDRSVTSIDIPDSVASIGNAAFQGCSKLTRINIPDSVTSIGQYSFRECSSLTNVIIPDSVTSIGQSAFSNCSSLTSVTIGSGVTTIEDNAFSKCFSLTSIGIPDSVTSIGNGAFQNCSALTSVTIGNGVTSIGDGAFSECTSLTSVDIPSGVTSIGDSAFYDCSSLTSVTIGNGVRSIGDGAFSECTSLTRVTIPDSVTSIGEWAFADCTALTSVIIPDSVTSIGEWAFDDCTALTSVTIGNGVRSIGDGAFSECTSLGSITVNAETPPTLATSAFDSTSDSLVIYVPAESVDAYKTATGWRSFASRIQAIQS